MNSHAISERQLTRMLFMEGFGASGISFPFLAAGTKSSGLPAVMLYVIWMLLLTAYLMWISRKVYGKNPSFPEKSSFSLPGTITGSIYILRFLINVFFLLWIFCTSIRQIYMPKMSLWLIMLPMILLLWYSIFSTLQKRARFIELLSPWIISLLIFMIIAALFGEHTGEISSFEKMNYPDVLKKSYLLLLGSCPVEFLFFLMPCAVSSLWQPEAGRLSATGKKRAVKKAVAGVVAANFALWYITVSALGPAITASSPWSAVKLLQRIHLPGGFLERIDSFLIIYWILCMVGVISGYLFYAKKIMDYCFLNDASKTDHSKSTKEENLSCFIIGALLLLMIPAVNTLERYTAMESLFLSYKMKIDFPLIILLPVLLYLRPHFKKKRIWKRAGMVSVLCLFLFTLSGCSTTKDIEDKNYVSSLYVDYADDQYQYTLAWADLSKMSESSGEVPCRTTTLAADSLSAMERDYTRKYSKELEWNHIYTIFLSENMQKEPKQILSFLKEWEKEWQKSPDVLLVLTKHTADTIYEIKSLAPGLAGQECSTLKENLPDSDNLVLTPIDALRAFQENRQTFFYVLSIDGEQMTLTKTKFLLFP